MEIEANIEQNNDAKPKKDQNKINEGTEAQNSH